MANYGYISNSMLSMEALWQNFQSIVLEFSKTKNFTQRPPKVFENHISQLQTRFFCYLVTKYDNDYFVCNYSPGL